MYKVLSLFSGCGGSDLGMIGGFEFLGKQYDQLPFDIACAIDNDKYAIDTFNANFEQQAICSDIQSVPTNTIPSVDIVVGGFPCQSFSTVNPTKNPTDDRGQLYKKMAHFLREKQPAAFIAENVKGMLVLRKGAIFRSIISEFERCGYVVRYQLINAADFGVPQKRQRVFMVGIRKDLGFAFDFPTPTHSENRAAGTHAWNGLGSVIHNVVPEDPKYFFSDKAVRGMKNAKKNMKRGLWQNLSEPCLTITSHLAKVSINSRDPVLLVDAKKERYRRFTPREAARIQSFPDSFVFPVSEFQAYRQIGNAIPPVLMWHISRALADQIQKNSKRQNVREKTEQRLVQHVRKRYVVGAA